MSFAMQWFALGAESYYFVLSIDLLLNLVLSPFGSPTSRTKYYHIFVVFTSTASAIALSRIVLNVALGRIASATSFESG